MKDYVIRHKYRLADFGLVLAATLLMTFAGLSVDIFANTGRPTPKATALELDELLAVVVVFFLGLIWAVRRLIRERRHAAERLSHGLGKIPPARFIAIAEDANLIAPPTDRLLAQACETAREWGQGVELSFNVSPLLLQDPGLPARILKTLTSTGFPTSRLELEITESALVKNMEAAQLVLGQLRAEGIKVALDDFGTGYSNLYHLRTLKVDKIKIDRSFIARMVGDHEAD